MTVKFSSYAVALQRASVEEIAADISLKGLLTLAEAEELVINYAPFDYIERGARVVIVGITPGEQQARNALIEARRQLLAGASQEVALAKAKVFASFSGAMRTNLVEMLDFIGLNRWLGVESTQALWQDRSDLVHFTSALRYPVFLRGHNYSGNPSITGTPLLRDLLNTYLTEEARLLPNAVWVPLGPVVTKGLRMLIEGGVLQGDRVLFGLPHPSGANAERIAYFVRRKERSALSAKTSAASLDAAREDIRARVASLNAT